ncbi:MAG: DUF1318 domain-containing protein [Candidatus Omnitrophica bacterium]|nr:DUF1318 domain-containing protein [Candidatus Omnitrophota bacterium]
MRKFLLLSVISVFLMSCTSVDLKTSKPLKVDVNVRIDVYQHIAEEVHSIEEEIYGDQKADNDLMSFFGLVTDAYAIEYPLELKPVIERRKKRSAEVLEALENGSAGENEHGYLEIIDWTLPHKKISALGRLIEAENSDRSIVFQKLARENQVEVSEIENAFFKEHFKKASGVCWFRLKNKEKGYCVWTQKGQADEVRGYNFADLQIPVLKNAEHNAYLGVEGKRKTFGLFDVKAKIVIVEIFSMYCPYCQEEAPEVNKFYDLLKSSGLSDRVKVMGIGGGNTVFEVEKFQKKYEIPFPLFPDKSYMISKTFSPGQVGTPHFLIIELLPDKRANVLYSKTGGFGSAERFLSLVQDLTEIK